MADTDLSCLVLMESLAPRELYGAGPKGGKYRAVLTALLTVQGTRILDHTLDAVRATTKVVRFTLSAPLQIGAICRQLEAWREERLAAHPEETLYLMDAAALPAWTPMDGGLLVVSGDRLIDFGFRRLLAKTEEKNGSGVACRERQDGEEPTEAERIALGQNNRLLIFSGHVCRKDAGKSEPIGEEETLPVAMPYFCFLASDLAACGQAREEGVYPGQPAAYLTWLFDQGRAVYGIRIRGMAMAVTDRASHRLAARQAFQAVPAAVDPPVPVVYEDEDLLVVNKPKGLVVHPVPGRREPTLVQALLYQTGGKLYAVDELIKPGVIHRLDMETSGALVFAKSERAYTDLTFQTKAHRMRKIYRALAWGVFTQQEGTIHAQIGRQSKNGMKRVIGGIDAKDSMTHFRVVEQFRTCALIECRLETGRTHQIRVHMEAIGHPLVGDRLYKGIRRKRWQKKRGWLRGHVRRLIRKVRHIGRQDEYVRILPEQAESTPPGQFLHAHFLWFHHPVTGEWVRCKAPLPDYFKETVRNLREEKKRCERIPGVRAMEKLSVACQRLREKLAGGYEILLPVQNGGVWGRKEENGKNE